MTENEAKLKLLTEQLSKKNTAKLAKAISEQILSGLKTNNKDLHNIFAELAVEITALTRRMDDAQKAPTTDFDKSFDKLADSLNKDVVASLSDEQMTSLAEHIGEKLSNAVSAINLEAVSMATDTVEVKGLDKMLNKLVDKIPDKIDGKVTLAYNKTSAKDYVNVRLTNGDAFVDSILGAVGRGPGLPLIKVAGDVMALPVVNPDGSFIGGSSSGTSDPRTGYGYSNSRTVSNVDYVGYLNKDGAWFVMKVDANDNAEYAVGNAGDYDYDNFLTWAPTLTFDTFDVAFN